MFLLYFFLKLPGVLTHSQTLIDMKSFSCLFRHLAKFGKVSYLKKTQTSKSNQLWQKIFCHSNPCPSHNYTMQYIHVIIHWNTSHNYTMKHFHIIIHWNTSHNYRLKHIHGHWTWKSWSIALVRDHAAEQVYNEVNIWHKCVFNVKVFFFFLLHFYCFSY